MRRFKQGVNPRVRCLLAGITGEDNGCDFGGGLTWTRVKVPEPV